MRDRALAAIRTPNWAVQVLKLAALTMILSLVPAFLWMQSLPGYVDQTSVEIPRRLTKIGETDLTEIICGTCNICGQEISFLEYSIDSSQTRSDSTSLFILPLNDFAMMSKTSLESYSSSLDSFVEEVIHSWEYNHFGGSNFVFLCLAEGCSQVFKDITTKYKLGKDSRAMWAGTRDIDASSWPCPNKVISISMPREEALAACGTPEQYERVEAMFVQSVLKPAAEKIKGMARWSCTRSKWDVDLTSLRGVNHQGCIFVREHNICVSGIPKCGSSTMNILLRRLMRIKSWNDTQGRTHGNRNGLKWVNSAKDFELYEKTMTDPSIVKISVLREPADRLLSAYKDKIENRREFGRIGYRGKKVPSFEWVVNHFTHTAKAGRMHSVDLHFRPMSEFGSLRLIRYDFVARVSSLGDDIKTILTSLGIWQEFGASGWGDNGDLSFKQAKGRNTRVSSKDGYYSPELLKEVEALYYEDYNRFGFSILDSWGHIFNETSES